MAKKQKALSESLPILNRLRKRIWPGMRKQQRVVVGSIVLAPAIVVSYAVKAAVRDDLEHGREVG